MLNFKVSLKWAVICSVEFLTPTIKKQIHYNTAACFFYIMHKIYAEVKYNLCKFLRNSVAKYTKNQSKFLLKLTKKLLEIGFPLCYDI